MADTKHWSKIQERGTYVGIQILLFVYRLFGRKVLSFFLYPVIVYLYFTGGATKQASKEYWQRIFAVKNSSQTYTHRIGIAHFYSFAQSAFDKIDAWMGRITPERIIYSQTHPIAELQKKQQGAVFIGSHLGNLEVCRALGYGRYQTRINVLVFTHHAVEFNKVLTRINTDSNVDLIQVTHVGADLAILIKDRIDNGEILVIAGDRTSVTSQGRVIYSPFLGEPAAFSQGAFILASILDCPVYFLFCLKEKNNYRVIFEHVAESLKFSRKDRQKSLTAVVNQYAQRLEHYCLAYPNQWFNFFDFWQNDQNVIREEKIPNSTNE
jgi:predicted LPLAT superfamily acyltransferase|tara:strand:+ start:2696 stop:3664 length:969 start_codon:yes stop_codon:yes gene_type:complete